MHFQTFEGLQHCTLTPLQPSQPHFYRVKQRVRWCSLTVHSITWRCVVPWTVTWYPWGDFRPVAHRFRFKNFLFYHSLRDQEYKLGRGLQQVASLRQRQICTTHVGIWGCLNILNDDVQSFHRYTSANNRPPYGWSLVAKFQLCALLFRIEVGYPHMSQYS